MDEMIFFLYRFIFTQGEIDDMETTMFRKQNKNILHWKLQPTDDFDMIKKLFKEFNWEN